MEYFMGETFDKEKNKPYKKLDAAEKAAEKQKAAVFDENGAVVEDFREKEEKPAEQQQTATDGSQEQQPADSTDQEGQEQQATMTDKVPEGALDTDADGNVPTFDADGNQVGTATLEEIKAAEEAVTENIDGVQRSESKERSEGCSMVASGSEKHLHGAMTLSEVQQHSQKRLSHM